MQVPELKDNKAVLPLPTHGARPNLRGNTGKLPLNTAIAAGDATHVDDLINAGASISHQDKYGFNCLHEAVLNQADPVILDILISAGADPDAQDIFGVTPLLMGVKRNDVRSVDVLLTYGANINIQDVDGWTPVLLSVANNFHAILRLLLAREPDCSLYRRGRSIFDIATEFGDLETNKILAAARLKC
jgi:ankyrin repeat protein